MPGGPPWPCPCAADAPATNTSPSIAAARRTRRSTSPRWLLMRSLPFSSWIAGASLPNRRACLTPMWPKSSERDGIVVVGGGFGGLQVARNLAGAPLEITLVDRRNFHLFQPLLYQVATGALARSEEHTSELPPL